MFARSTTVLAHRDLIDDGVAYVRDEVMTALLGTDGCIGLSMLVDRESCRCIATSAWQTREAMAAAEGTIRPVRERAVELLGGNRPQVDEWEIALLHRDHTSAPGACVRATWVRVDADQVERALDTYKMAILPSMQEFDGFCSASMMLDRAAGMSVSSVTFDSVEAMERSREDAERMRTQGVRDLGIEILDVAEFELAIAHLRVPELV